MFYCEKCRIEKDWPESITKSYGKCEICEDTCECHDRPSSQLPAPTKTIGVKNLESLKTTCDRIIQLVDENVDGDLMAIQLCCLAENIKDFVENPVVRESGVLEAIQEESEKQKNWDMEN